MTAPNSATPPRPSSTEFRVIFACTSGGKADFSSFPHFAQENGANAA